MLFVSILLLGSCSKDDEPAVPAAKAVAGSYFGDMSCSVMGSESVFDNLSFDVEATSDALATIHVPSFGESPMQVPDIDITDVPVTENADGSYSLKSTSFEGTLSSGKQYSGVIEGSVNNATLTVNFNLQYGAMPMPMICSFIGSKK